MEILGNKTSAYSHAQYGNRSVAFIKRAATSSKPFFVFVGTTGPHLPAQPAPWHQALADSLNISAPRTPNFNMLASDHFDLLSTHPILTPGLVGDIDHLMKQRWGTLLSIDDLVAGLHQAVDDAGLLDSTYFLFSSDHVRWAPLLLRAYHSFRNVWSKYLPKSGAIRPSIFERIVVARSAAVALECCRDRQLRCALTAAGLQCGGCRGTT